MRVEPGRYEHQSRAVRAGYRHDHVLHQGEPLVVAGTRWHGQVEGVSLALARPVVRHGARAGIKRRLVDARVQHRVRSWKMSLVPLPWWTSQSSTRTRSMPCSSSACCAATATLLKMQKPIAAPFGMVARRPQSAKCHLGFASEQRVDCANRPAGGMKRGIERPSDATVSTSSIPPPCSQIRRIASTYGLWMNRLEAIGIDGRRLLADEPEPAAFLERSLDCRYAGSLLRMVAGVVFERGPMVEGGTARPLYGTCSLEHR